MPPGVPLGSPGGGDIGRQAAFHDRVELLGKHLVEVDRPSSSRTLLLRGKLRRRLPQGLGCRIPDRLFGLRRKLTARGPDELELPMHRRLEHLLHLPRLLQPLLLHLGRGGGLHLHPQQRPNAPFDGLFEHALDDCWLRDGRSRLRLIFATRMGRRDRCQTESHDHGMADAAKQAVRSVHRSYTGRNL